MTDFGICLATGDYPSPNFPETQSHKGVEYSDEQIAEFKRKGYVRESNGRWYDPNDYIDSLYANW